jgi:hypothetical protein
MAHFLSYSLYHIKSIKCQPDKCDIGEPSQFWVENIGENFELSELSSLCGSK